MILDEAFFPFAKGKAWSLRTGHDFLLYFREALIVVPPILSRGNGKVSFYFLCFIEVSSRSRMAV